MRYLLTYMTLLFSSHLTSSAQSVKPLVDSDEFVFQVRHVAGTRNPYVSTSNYTMTVTKDEIACELHYFNGNDAVPTDTSILGLQFNSAHFTYNKTPGKRGGWVITINPKDNLDVWQLILSVTGYGEATLMVYSNSRRPTRFIGRIVSL